MGRQLEGQRRPAKPRGPGREGSRLPRTTGRTVAGQERGEKLLLRSPSAKD